MRNLRLLEAPKSFLGAGVLRTGAGAATGAGLTAGLLAP